MAKYQSFVFSCECSKDKQGVILVEGFPCCRECKNPMQMDNIVGYHNMQLGMTDFGGSPESSPELLDRVSV